MPNSSANRDTRREQATITTSVAEEYEARFTALGVSGSVMAEALILAFRAGDIPNIGPHIEAAQHAHSGRKVNRDRANIAKARKRRWPAGRKRGSPEP